METIIFILFDAFKGANNVAKTFKDFLSPIIATIGTYLMMVIILIIGQSSVIAIAAGAFTKTGNAVDSILNLYFGISVALIIIYQAASRFISRKNAKKNKKIEFKQQDTFYYSLIKQIILIAVSIAVVVSGAYTVSLIVLTLLKTFLDIRGYLRNPPEPDVVEKWFKAKV